MSTGPTRVSFEVLGRRLTATGVDEGLARWLAHHWDRSHHRVPHHPMTIEVRCAPAPDSEAPYLAHLPDRHDAGADAASPRLTTHGAGSAAVLLGSRSGGAYLEIGVDGAVVVAWGVQGPAAPGRWPLLLTLHEAVRASGLLPLHCAAAVRPGDDGATAFLGRSGAGKSTTLLTLAQAGWAPVCEDYAWLDPTSMRLYAWDTAVRLTPDTLARLEPMRTHPATASADPKRLLDYDELAERFGTPRRTEAPVARLVHVERGTGASRWGSLAPEAAVPALWQAVGLPLTGYARQQVARQIGRLVRSVELASLHVGHTPVPPRGPG